MRTKKFIAVFATIILVLGCFTMPASAATRTLPDYSMTQAQWEQMWKDSVDDDCNFIALTPGSDETELNFSWHSKLGLKNEALKISKNSDMSGAVEFKATWSLAEFGYRKNAATVDKLEENTVYYYTFSQDGKWSAPQLYRTLSADAFKALFVSDIQIGDKEGTIIEAYSWQTALSTALAANDDISFIVSAGDNTHHDDITVEWAGVLAPPAMRNIPFAAAVGNHDDGGFLYNYYTNNPNRYNGITPSIYGKNYYFRYGDVLFLFINSNNINMVDHSNFLKNAILENIDAKWRVAVMHHDVYGPGEHATDDTVTQYMKLFPPMFDKYDIDLVLTGHDHIYSRSHYMLNGKVVNTNIVNNTATDPNGTLYVSGSTVNNRRLGHISEVQDYEWSAFTLTNDSTHYSILAFDSDSLAIETYSVKYGNKIDSHTIVKTKGFADLKEEKGYDFLVIKEIIIAYLKAFEKVNKFLSKIGVEL